MLNNYYFAHMISDMPGIYDYEILFYNQDLKKFADQLTQTAKDAADSMYDTYTEYYHCADFSHLWDEFEEDELAIADENKSKDKYDNEIVWQVILWRIDKVNKLINQGWASYKYISYWLDLYNDYNEAAFIDIIGQVELKIKIGDIKDFPDYLLDYLLVNINGMNKPGYLAEMEPFKENIQKLALLTKRDEWPHRKLDVGRFLEWVYIFENLLKKYNL